MHRFALSVMNASVSPRRNLPLLVMHVHEAAISLFRPILKHHGLTDQQWRVLRAVWTGPDGLEPGQIAESCKILSPSLTGILSRLEMMELVTRHWSEVDQRRQTIRLTARGEALTAQIYPLIEAQYQLIEASLGHEGLTAIYTDLERMLGLLQQPIARVPLAGGNEAQAGKRKPIRTDHRGAE